MDKEWFARFPKLTVLPWLLWAVIAALAIAFIFHAGRASAEPLFVVQDKGVTITFYDDPCQLTDKVSNLPYKATWQEGGKTFQGCAAPRADLELVVVYFDDLTVALVPFHLLKKATGA